MGLLSNRVTRESLKAGDHIYSWRTAYLYSHHGIYVGDDKVIHFTRGRQEVGFGTVPDLLLTSSVPSKSQESCPNCRATEDVHGVISSCLNCFLAGGELYRFEYGVSRALFLAKARGGTCTLADSEEDDIVLHRAKHLLENGFGCYDVFKNNCENFAIYCKTGLVVVDQGTIGQSGQAASIIGGPLATVLSIPLRLVTKSICGMAVTAAGVYCASRYAADIGTRSDVAKVQVEDLTNGMAATAIGMGSNVVKVQGEDLTNVFGVAATADRVYNVASRYAATAVRVYNVASRYAATAVRVYNVANRDVATAVRVYNVANRYAATAVRYAADIGMRRDMVKVQVEDLKPRG